MAALHEVWTRQAWEKHSLPWPEDLERKLSTEMKAYLPLRSIEQAERAIIELVVMLCDRMIADIVRSPSLIGEELSSSSEETTESIPSSLSNIGDEISSAEEEESSSSSSSEGSAKPISEELETHRPKEADLTAALERLEDLANTPGERDPLLSGATSIPFVAYRAERLHALAHVSGLSQWDSLSAYAEIWTDERKKRFDRATSALYKRSFP